MEPLNTNNNMFYQTEKKIKEKSNFIKIFLKKHRIIYIINKL